MEDCVTCGKVLGGRQHALVCQSCSGRIHRTCTDVSVKTYRRIQSGESVIAYTCDGCKAIPEMSDTVSTASSASPGRQDEVEDMELDDDVLKKVKSLFPEPPAVKGFVMDFEPAMWGAVRKVFPEATVDGCEFHWTQAVWRNVQSLALGTEYMKKDATHHFIRQLLALPLLPAEHIVPVFCHLEEKVTEHLKPLMKYIRNTWIQGSVWKPKDWSVFGQSVRTNNDCEGWHRRMNTRSVSPPPFYLLIHRLHKEASFLTHQLKLVSEKKLKKRQRTAYKKSQAKIFSCWDTYRAGEVSATKLLKKLSAVYAHIYF